MKKLINTLAVCVGVALSSAVEAQGLIGEPRESERDMAVRLELERARIFHHGLKDFNIRRVYGSIVWRLAESYELLNRWQDALAAQNTFDDLKLPPNAIANCTGCVFSASEEVFNIDRERLHDKICTVEAVDKVVIDRTKRLPTPQWGPEQMWHGLIARKVPLRSTYVTSVEELLKER